MTNLNYAHISAHRLVRAKGAFYAQIARSRLA